MTDPWSKPVRPRWTIPALVAVCAVAALAIGYGTFAFLRDRVPTTSPTPTPIASAQDPESLAICKSLADATQEQSTDPLFMDTVTTGFFRAADKTISDHAMVLNITANTAMKAAGTEGQFEKTLEMMGAATRLRTKCVELGYEKVS